MAVSAGELRVYQWPAGGFRRLADSAGESAVRTRGGQSALAVAFRRRNTSEPERFRKTRGKTERSGTARLAGFGVRGPQLQHEGDQPADGHFRRLQEVIPSATRTGDEEYGGGSERHVLM